jgi:hypothetical protein
VRLDVPANDLGAITPPAAHQVTSSDIKLADIDHGYGLHVTPGVTAKRHPHGSGTTSVVRSRLVI